MFCRISAFWHLRHLRFSVLTPVHRIRDPLVFCDDSGEVRWFLNLFTGFCWFLTFFTLFGTFATAILCIYPDAPGKGSPCVLRQFSAGPGCFGFFLQISPISVTFLHFSSICHLRFPVFTSMHRVRDPLVFCDDSREVRDLLTFFTRFCRFWFFCVHFCDEFSLDFDISWCPARLRLTLHGVQITLI